MRGEDARHVRDGPVGRRPQGTVARARQGGHQAPVLRRGRRPAGLRLGAEGNPAAPRRGTAPGLGRGQSPVHFPEHSRRGEHRAGRAQARARARLDRFRGRGDTDRALLGRAFRARRKPERGDPRGAAAGAARGIGPPPPGQRRAPGGLPERRHRLELRGRDHGAPVVRTREDVLDRLRRGGLRRAALRPPGRGAIWHGAPRAGRHAGRGGHRGRPGVVPGRAVRRLLGHPDLRRIKAGLAVRHRGPLGRRRGRAVRGLRQVPRGRAGAALRDRARPRAQGDREHGRLDARGSARPKLPAALFAGRCDAVPRRVDALPDGGEETAVPSGGLRNAVEGGPVPDGGGLSRPNRRSLAVGPAVPGHEDLSASRHPDEGGQDEHGAPPGGAGAAPRSPSRGVRRRPSARSQAARRGDQIHLQARHARHPARRRHRQAETGVRRPARPVVQGPARRLRPRPAALGDQPESRHLRREVRRESPRVARERPASGSAAVDPDLVRALVPDLSRQPDAAIREDRRRESPVRSRPRAGAGPGVRSPSCQGRRKESSMRPFRRRLSRAAALWLLALPSPVAAYLTDQAVYPPINEAIFLPPEAGGSYIDPTFGTTITRLSDAPKTPNAADAGSLPLISNEYSTMSPWSEGNAHPLLVPHSYFALYDGEGHYVKDLPLEVNATSQPRWSRRSPDVFYYLSGNTLKSYDVATDARAVVRVFDEYTGINGLGESDISSDGDHFVLVGDFRDVFVYEISTDTKGSVLDTTGLGGFDDVYITPDNNVLVGWYAVGSAPRQGVELYDRDMRFLRQVSRTLGHMDVARDVDGSEVLLLGNASDPEPVCSNGMVKIRLSDGRQTCLVTFDWSMSVHISAPDRGGFVIVGTYAPADPDPTLGFRTYTDEIMQVSLDGSEVRRLAHHRSRPFNSYGWTPRASVSRDGSRLVYSSNYGLQEILGYPSSYSDTYLIDLSQTSPSSAGSQPWPARRLH